MNFSLVMPILAIVLIGALAYGVKQYRRFKYIEKVHRDFAEKIGLHPVYVNESNFNIFGSYRTYPLRVIPHMIVKQSPATQIIIPMTNPNLKWMRIGKNLQAVSGFEQVSQHDKASPVTHQIDSSIEIASNDMIFSSLILSDNVKISIFEAFQDFQSAMLAIDGDMMFFITPGRIEKEDYIPKLEKAINLMCDIKDELN